jgi:hypothetical protein
MLLLPERLSNPEMAEQLAYNLRKHGEQSLKIQDFKPIKCPSMSPISAFMR